MKVHWRGFVSPRRMNDLVALKKDETEVSRRNLQAATDRRCVGGRQWRRGTMDEEEYDR